MYHRKHIRERNKKGKKKKVTARESERDGREGEKENKHVRGYLGFDL